VTPDAARLREHIRLWLDEIAAHKAAIGRHRRQLKTAHVALNQARAALMRIDTTPVAKKEEGVLHGQHAVARP
jgi:hypothetical protein